MGAFSKRLVRRTNGNDDCDDLVECRNGKLMNKVLNVEVAIDGCAQINVDETSIDPNETVGKRLVMNNLLASCWKGSLTDTEMQCWKAAAVGTFEWE